MGRGAEKHRYYGDNHVQESSKQTLKVKMCILTLSGSTEAK